MKYLFARYYTLKVSITVTHVRSEFRNFMVSELILLTIMKLEANNEQTSQRPSDGSLDNAGR